MDDKKAQAAYYDPAQPVSETNMPSAPDQFKAEMVFALYKARAAGAAVSLQFFRGWLLGMWFQAEYMNTGEGRISNHEIAVALSASAQHDLGEILKQFKALDEGAHKVIRTAQEPGQ